MGLTKLAGSFNHNQRRRPMSKEQQEFIQAFQNAQDEAYSVGDYELAVSWSEHILDVLNNN